MGMEKRLLFIRHGHTLTNSENLIHKRGTVESLDELGRAQAKKLIKVCAENNIEAVFTSPEIRTFETAQIITEGLNLDIPKTLENLRERSWGDWEGKDWNDVQKLLDNMSLIERYKFIPPNGESWEEMEQRLQLCLTQILNYEYKNIAIITHGGALRALMPILNNAPKESSFQYNFHNASVTIFDFINGKYKEIIINDISHLTEI